MTERLTLKKSLEMSRLDEFITQEESRGIDPADSVELMEALAITIKQPRSEGQTSRSSY